MDRRVDSLNLNDDNDHHSPVDGIVYNKADNCSSVSNDNYRSDYNQKFKFVRDDAQRASHRR